MKAHVQTFRARSPREALTLVKRSLGADAVILGTRTVAPEGVQAWMKRPWTEITAAAADLPSPAPRLTRPASSPSERSTTRAEDVNSIVPRELYPHFVKLVEQEVATDVAAAIVRRAACGGAEVDDSVLRAAVRDYLREMMPEDNSVDNAGPGSRCIAFVGPSGVGKTSAIAKLAVRYKLNEGRSVRLISLDMYRPGAHEQLQRYAEIIGVPFLGVQTQVEARQCRQLTEDDEVVLVDTPGVGLQEQQLFARVAVLLRAVRPDRTYLVLPASYSATVLKTSARGFEPLQPDGLVLTHLDDVVGLGVILNAVEQIRMRVAYLSTGQRVNADLEEACESRIAELILIEDR